MKVFLIERLHRYVFDFIYDQNYTIKIIDKVILWFYNKVIVYNHDWRYNLYCSTKSFNRYSKVSRIN